LIAAATQAGKTPGREGLERRKLRVLVVDDNRDEVLTLMEIVRDEGHDARGIYNGRDVLDAVREFDPDVVLLDIGMPDRNGYDVARKIVERYEDRRPRLVAVTGWKKSSDRMLAQMAGFDHHIAKPYAPTEIVAVLRPRDSGLEG
jgi:DNA-binding response OmpR family regulator